MFAPLVDDNRRPLRYDLDIVPTRRCRYLGHALCCMVARLSCHHHCHDSVMLSHLPSASATARSISASSTPKSASASALSFHLSPLCPFTCFHHTLTPPSTVLASCRLAALISPIFALGCHSPTVILHAYSESYLIHTLPSVGCFAAHASALMIAVQFNAGAAGGPQSNVHGGAGVR